MPEEVSTLVENVELLPPPWSAWSIRQISRSLASSSVYFLSALFWRKIYSAVEISLIIG